MARRRTVKQPSPGFGTGVGSGVGGGGGSGVGGGGGSGVGGGGGSGVGGGGGSGGGVTVIPTCDHPFSTAFCSRLFIPNNSPAASTVRSAASWKLEVLFIFSVSALYQICPAFSQAKPPISMAVR